MTPRRCVGLRSPDCCTLDGGTARAGKTGHAVDRRQTRRSDTEDRGDRRVRGIVHRRVGHPDRGERVGAGPDGEAPGQEAGAGEARAAAGSAPALSVDRTLALGVTRGDRTGVVERALRARPFATARVDAVEDRTCRRDRRSLGSPRRVGRRCHQRARSRSGAAPRHRRRRAGSRSSCVDRRTRRPSSARPSATSI